MDSLERPHCRVGGGCHALVGGTEFVEVEEAASSWTQLADREPSFTLFGEGACADYCFDEYSPLLDSSLRVSTRLWRLTSAVSPSFLFERRRVEEGADPLSSPPFFRLNSLGYPSRYRLVRPSSSLSFRRIYSSFSRQNSVFNMSALSPPLRCRACTDEECRAASSSSPRLPTMLARF
jgi:hypothetical protein